MADIDIFDREAVFIDRSGHARPLLLGLPGTEGGSSQAHHHQGRGRVRGRSGRARLARRSPRTMLACATATRYLRRRHPAPYCTTCRCSSARPMRTRAAGRGARSQSGSLRRFLPRHGLRAAACTRPEGTRLRLRGLLHGTPCRWSCTPKPSMPPARSTSWKALPASTARRSYACATPARSRCRARTGSCRPNCRTATTTLRAAARRRDPALEGAISDLLGIDWTRPWFWPFAASGVALASASDLCARRSTNKLKLPGWRTPTASRFASFPSQTCLRGGL